MTRRLTKVRWVGAVGAIATILVLCWVTLGVPARQAAVLAHCAEHLKRIGEALRKYHEDYGTCPPAYVLGKDGERMHSWRVLILPQLGHQHLYEQYRFDEPWDSPNNSRLISQVPREFTCPADTARTTGETNYVAVVGCRTAWPEHLSARFSAVRDGTSNSVWVIETCSARVPWTSPNDVSLTDFANSTSGRGPHAFGSRHHPSGALAVFMDGATRFLAADVRKELLGGLGTIATGVPWPGAPCNDRLEYSESDCDPNDADGLARTEVVPVPNAAIHDKNMLYCATFQLAWDELRGINGGGPLLLEGDPALATALNASPFPRQALSSSSYVAVGGAGPSVRDEFLRQCHEKFQISIDVVPAKPVRMAGYCYLQKRLPFAAKFERLTNPLSFHVGDETVRVAAFGLAPDRPDCTTAQERQVKVVHYASDDDFVLQLTTLTDSILLAKVAPRGTLFETWEFSSRAETAADQVFRPGDSLAVPCIALLLEKNFDELCRRITNLPDDHRIDISAQITKFQLDESGVVLESFDEYSEGNEEPIDSRRRFHFDRPFLVALQEVSAERPYFLMWIANEELLLVTRERGHDK